MINRIIVFLLRKKFHLKKCEEFMFENQNSTKDTYYFTENKLWKKTRYAINLSHVSLNWLLDSNCKIKKV